MRGKISKEGGGKCQEGRETRRKGKGDEEETALGVKNGRNQVLKIRGNER